MTRHRPHAALALGAAALVLGLAACGGQAATSAGAAPPGATPSAAAPVDPNAAEVNAAGDIPDNQVFVPFSAPDGAYRVSVPEGWARSSDATATTFTDKFNSVRVESMPRPAAPTVASATAGELPGIASTTPGYAPGKVTDITRRAGPGVLITYTATSPPDPVTGKSLATAVERYEFWKNGREAVLTLSGPQGADNVDPWHTVSDSFGWSS